MFQSGQERPETEGRDSGCRIVAEVRDAYVPASILIIFDSSGPVRRGEAALKNIKIKLNQVERAVYHLSVHTY